MIRIWDICPNTGVEKDTKSYYISIVSLSEGGGDYPTLKNKIIDIKVVPYPVMCIKNLIQTDGQYFHLWYDFTTKMMKMATLSISIISPSIIVSRT